MILNVRKLFMPFLLLMFVGQVAFAQQNVTGTVIDAETNDVLIGASISLKGDPTRGTITGPDGNFLIKASSGETLVISYVGYIRQEFVLTAQSSVVIALEPSTETLEGVVVIGYGKLKKSDATGSVTAISSDDFNRGAITSPQQLLSGKTSGVQITDGGGAPGSGSTIRIRGGSSLSASNSPLIVVDGVPLDNDGVSGMRNPLNAINPNDIETFTILKDASATAIYGSRASNGVIIITTKKGKLGAPMKISYDGKASLYTLSNTLDVLGADEFRSMVQEQYADNPNALGLLGDANTDWQSEILRNSIGHDHNVSISGSSKNLPYRASIGYSNVDGTLLTSQMERYTGAFNLNPSYLNNHLKVNISAKGMSVKNRFANRGALGAAMAMDPTQSVMDEDNAYGGYYTWLQPNGNPITIATQNPLAQLELRNDNSNVQRFIGNAQFDYRFKAIPELRANLNLATDMSESSGSISVPAFAVMNWDLVGDNNLAGGVDAFYNQTKRNELLDFYMNYNKALSGINSKLDVMAGYSWQHFYRAGNYVETNEQRSNTISNTDYATESYLVSFFGRMNFSVADKYLFTATLRNDGSSRFSPENRWGFFPSAAFAWKINNEAFLKDVDAISELKFRVGYGVTGQQNITSGDYPYLSRYTFSENTAMYMFGNAFIQTLRPEGYDANLKWEETTTFNVGLDFGLFNDRIFGSLEYYSRETIDLINTIPVPAGTNLTNQILTNVGNLTNEGIEFNIVGRPVSTEDLMVEIGYNISYNKNTITKLTATDQEDYKGVFVGGIAGGVGNTIQIHTVGLPSYSYYVYEQVYDNVGNPIEGLYVDRNNDGVITDEDKYHYYKPTADYFMGLSARVMYKNWDFAAGGRASIGNYVYNNVSSSMGVAGGVYNSVGYLNNVKPEAVAYGFENYNYFSDHYIENASYFRLDNISLGYQINNLADKVNLHVSLTVQNALVISKYSGLDPEVFGGIDNNIYPRPRVFLLGLKLDF
ncbi:MAG: SusC/RagA family TonB-linked outer membrane protein [Bacteroidales bacterium]|nr:SusC/RagA family TonB-linked outer membrane protein [Bacteroidales bacterium]